MGISVSIKVLRDFYPKKNKSPLVDPIFKKDFLKKKKFK